LSLRAFDFGATGRKGTSETESVVTEAMGPPDIPVLRSSSAIAAAPKRPGAVSDLKRLLPYLVPHRAALIIAHRLDVV
jgi:hypothetical protein